MAETLQWLRELTYECYWETASGCLVPLSGRLAHAHQQLLRLMTAQWQALHAFPASGVADTVDGILASKGVEGGSIVAAVNSSMPGVADAAKAPPPAAAEDGVLSLLQFAARSGKAGGMVHPGSEGATKRAYEQLEALVPGLT